LSASGTGLKLRLFAAVTSLSRSAPPAFSSRRAASSVAQPLSWMRGSPRRQFELLAAPRRLHHLPGIPADGVVCTMMTPAAPWRAALSYLYVQRP
jgi:hypothetical protein